MMMRQNSIKYLVNKSTTEDVLKHLSICKSNFKPPLDVRIDLVAYSSKIVKKTCRFEAWSGEELVGLLAIYFDTPKAYISNVSVVEDYAGHGIGSNLLQSCISYAKKHKCSEISLEVDENDSRAIAFYYKYNFVVSQKSQTRIFMKLDLSMGK